jgi:hypothetical protein
MGRFVWLKMLRRIHDHCGLVAWAEALNGSIVPIVNSDYERYNMSVAIATFSTTLKP